MADNANKKAIKVLIVEDVAEDAELMADELGRGAFQVDYRVVQDEATLKSSIAHFQPDIILADYRLPTFNGLEALFVSRELAPNIPFVYVTGAVGEEITAETILSGAWGLVLKDNISRLSGVVEKALSDENLMSRRVEITSKRIHTRIVENLEALDRIHAFMKNSGEGANLSHEMEETLRQLRDIQHDLEEDQQ